MSVKNINKNILRQCREQIGLSPEVVEEKVPGNAAFEQGTKNPSFEELNILADLYQVSDWVFIGDRLPDEYDFFKASAAFRKFFGRTNPKKL